MTGDHIFLRDNFLEAEHHLLRARVPQPEAEMEAARITAGLARNLGCSWPDLRTALSDRPAILALLPDDRDDMVDALPLGPASWAVKIGGWVRRQGGYVEASDPTDLRVADVS